MKIVMAGSSGLIGTALCETLRSDGHQVLRLVRSKSPHERDVAYWDPQAGLLEPNLVSGVDAVINLAGENVASGLWTQSKKETLRTSRVSTTQLISKTLASLSQPPSTFVQASAIGFYGSSATPLDESSPAGTGFLPELCGQWEAATEPAQKAGVRVALMRIGLVLAAQGGMLSKMLPVFRRGLGGKLGSGAQPMSWVSLNDVVSLFLFALKEPTLKGPINVVAPRYVSNVEFTQALAHVLKRSARFGVPAFMIRTLLGQMGEELLLGGAPVLPKVALQTGYVFQDSDLESTLQQLLAYHKSSVTDL